MRQGTNHKEVGTHMLNLIKAIGATDGAVCEIERELGWKPAEAFETGIRKTIQWYLDNPLWVEGVVSGSYRNWLTKQYS